MSGISNEQAAREREYWIQEGMRPRTEEGRRNLARAQRQWREAVEAADREAARRSGKPTGGDKAEDLELAELGVLRSAYARRRWPRGSEVYELQHEAAIAGRMVAALRQRTDERAWSQTISDEVEEWEMRQRLATDRAVLAIQRGSSTPKESLYQLRQRNEAGAAGEQRAKEFLRSVGVGDDD